MILMRMEVADGKVESELLFSNDDISREVCPPRESFLRSTEEDRSRIIKTPRRMSSFPKAPKPNIDLSKSNVTHVQILIPDFSGFQVGVERVRLNSASP